MCLKKWVGTMISVIVPTYNKECFIKRCIKSVLESTMQDFELLIIDDGSTDKTVEVIKCFADTRIRFYKQKRNGPGAARNKGINLSRGEFILFLDSDDTINKDTLQMLLDGIRENDVAIGNYNVVYDNGKVEKFINPTECAFNAFFESVTIWHRLYRSSFLKKNKVKFENIFQGEDRLFLAKLYIKKPNFVVIDKFVYNWFRHETSQNPTLTHINDGTLFKDQLKCMVLFKDILEHKIDYEEKRYLFEHLRYSCLYLLDILKYGNYKECDVVNFNNFIKSLRFDEDSDLFNKICNNERGITIWKN